MFSLADTITIGILMFLCVVLLWLLNYVMARKNKKQLEKIFVVIFILVIYWMLCLILQLLSVNKYNANPIYFDYFVYISLNFTPVAFVFMALIFAKTKITFKKGYYLLFVIPILSLIMLWTNDFHHLFYVVYSTNFTESVYGPFLYIYLYYSYLLYGISLFILMRYSIKNSGFFSKQAMLILIGTLVPIVVNVLGTFGIIPMTIYITPITFAITIICYTFAIFRLNLFKATPIALQRIVDRISDSYIVINDEYKISDYNKTLITTFKIKNEAKMRGKDFNDFLKECRIDIEIKKISECIEKVINKDITQTIRIYVNRIDKHFNVEISSIINNRQLLGILILFKDITQHIEDMKNLEENQSILLEKERLATLGQMIGGVAHNLKTPIMSISGATEGLEDLVNEYSKSVSDPEVTVEDHHAIAQDMMNWIIKIRSYNNYMSDIITAVKGQAVNMNENQNQTFTVEELLSRVNILMKHELKAAYVSLNEQVQIPKDTKINGNVNSLVQVVNNLISNAIQAYEKLDIKQTVTASGSSFIKGSGSEFGTNKINSRDKEDISTPRIINLIIFRKNDNIIISVTDYGCGMTKEIKDKLFKQMVTTKGHNGSGLGLFMSYSTIKGNFHGNINFTSKVGEGTTFNIILPMTE